MESQKKPEVEKEHPRNTRSRLIVPAVILVPVLVYMQKRDAEQPFFVMWVDNAELLTRR
ncbi:MAG TPA: hypothetical protein PKH24_05670 [Sedimentisphaerales bacterium]|jgi:hypothetical protein|nr:hypothetical protein [Sedimentisphaerales bacterium]HNU29072.1 hypothetical protein [Sedimentisphaerales bacterium]